MPAPNIVKEALGTRYRYNEEYTLVPQRMFLSYASRGYEKVGELPRLDKELGHSGETMLIMMERTKTDKVVEDLEQDSSLVDATNEIPKNLITPPKENPDDLT